MPISSNKLDNELEEYEKEANQVKGVKILSFDIEVSPARGFFYPPTWETSILKAIDRQKLMSFAWEWITPETSIDGKRKIKSLALSDMSFYKKQPEDDLLLTKELHKIMSEADVILGQNSDQFDVKMANYFFLMNGLPPISPKKFIDTKKVGKRYFRMLNNTLNNYGEELGVGTKTKIKVADLWEECFVEQNMSAWKQLKIYNEQDVRVTTNVYLKFRPWIANHPSLSREANEFDTCPKCRADGETYIVRRGWHKTKAMKYKAYTCTNCLGWLKSSKGVPLDYDVRPQFQSI